MTPWTKKDFAYSALGNLNLYYMGKKEGFLNHSYGPHRLDTYLLILVLEGSADFQICGRPVHVQKNSFYVMYPQSDMFYTTTPDQPWSIQWIVAGGEQMESILSMLHLTRENPVLPISRPDKLKRIYADLFEKVNRADLSAKMECLSLLYEVFAQLAAESETASHNPHVCQALEYISTHYQNPFSIQELSDCLHLDSNYFSRLFRREMGISPVKYIRRIRFEKACHLLKYTTLSVSRIAQETGFPDTLYFSRAFKQSCGCSPSDYREKHQR